MIVGELQTKVALVLAKWLGETGTISPQFLPIADDILDIPEIAEAFAALAREDSYSSIYDDPSEN